MSAYDPDLIATLPANMREVWNAFASHPDPVWSRVDTSPTDGPGLYGFDLLSGGHVRLHLSLWEEGGEVGVVDEFYVHGFSVEGVVGDKPLSEALDLIADEVAGGIASNDPDGYGPEDVHPLIRDEVTRLLREDYTTGVW